MYIQSSLIRVHPSMFLFCLNLASNSLSENVIQINPYIKVLSLLSVPDCNMLLGVTQTPVYVEHLRASIRVVLVSRGWVILQ